MKTLVANYLPRGQYSYTKKLVDKFLAAVEGQDVEVLDLTKDVPDFFMADNLQAYIDRNFMGKALSPQQSNLLAKMDRMIEQLKQADIVVMAFPMYNFSLPAIVKAYFDSVMLKGQTWDITQKGYEGFLKGKKALILMASGGVYEGEMAAWEHAATLAEIEFKFMGFSEVRKVLLQGVNKMADKIDEITAQGLQEIDVIVKEWYR